jgi:hypothetical protein
VGFSVPYISVFGWVTGGEIPPTTRGGLSGPRVRMYLDREARWTHVLCTPKNLWRGCTWVLKLRTSVCSEMELVAGSSRGEISLILSVTSSESPVLLFSPLGLGWGSQWSSRPLARGEQMTRPRCRESPYE